jgi:Recombination enhancement, RecA-dependent nuclease
MRINPLPVYQKGTSNKRSKGATEAQRTRWKLIRQLGCRICRQPPEIHHCETGGGGRKDHDKVIGLCYYHHRGTKGIHTLSRSVWEALFGTEQEHMEQTAKELGEPRPACP